VIEIQLQAARIVLEVLSGRNLTTVLAHAKARANRLSTAEWAGVQEISYGVFRGLGQLRAVLAQLLNKPLRDRDVEALLLVALYQLEFMRDAAHAVVDHAVQACARLHKASAKGLVNAVLRGFLRRRAELVEDALRCEEAAWSYPSWWIDEIRRAYPEQYKEILQAGNARPPMTLRVNTRKNSLQDYLAHLRTAGMQAEAVGESALVLEQPVAVAQLPGFENGLVSVQDLSAQYTAPLLDLCAGQRVLDACAAPGGKTAHILERADVQLTAIDSAPERLARVQENLDRLQLSAELICADAAQLDAWWDKRPFDRILLDVPCTASGIVRRHPDIKWLRRPTDIAGFAAQQMRLLQALWRTLAAGGKLLYVTCSVFPAENRLQIAEFLRTHPDATSVQTSAIVEGPGAGDLKGQILPDSRHDGFFYALLLKA